MSDQSATQTLEEARHGPVCTLTLNRPQAHNAMSLAMVLELREALARAEGDGRTRVLVLRGHGGHFCAGADLKDLVGARQQLAGDADALARLDEAYGDLCVAFARTPLAAVAVLQGTVTGVGIGLACAADVVLAGESTVFRLPETALGLVATQVLPFLVERLGPAETRRLAITGAALSASEAASLRLVHAVHPDDQLDEALPRVLAEILRGAPGAVASTKLLIARARHHRPEALVHEAALAFSAAVQGDEGQEGLAAYLARRPALWVPRS
jgi:isohexenylglutaconyl-CoA hydratase